MYRLKWIFWFGFALTIACSQNSQQSTNLPQDEFIQVYFNHRESKTQTYSDPYRKIERQGDNLELVIIQEIAAAKFTIDLAVHELNLPLVAQALVKSQNSGVQIRVILDNNYSRSLSKLNSSEIDRLNQRDRQKYNQFFQLVDLNQDNRLSSAEIAQRDALVILENAGIPVIDDTADGSKGSGLMHHKFMVVDRKTIVTGSVNFTLSDTHGDIDNPETKGNVNHLLRIENTEVADLFTEEFNYMWGNTPDAINSKFGLRKPWRSPKTFIWQDTQFTLQFAPTSASLDWRFSTNGLIDKTIDSATKSIDLALFVFSEQEIVDTLQQKHQQGIEIAGVFDSGFAYRYYSEVLDMLGVTLYLGCQAEAANNAWSNPLNTVGIAQLATGDKLHHKFALIDNQTVISGSHNWSKAANTNNDETLIIIKNSLVSQHFAQEFQHLYSSALLGLSAKINYKLEQQQQKCS
ncbi:MAG TPA: phospholipase D-like domain-containing protein [Coleofasciculaceae cyanobacterium]|jgi:phosphatidylserine/phosphatidylglycerophosphate/cardiolipin synthase-like enzyme